MPVFKVGDFSEIAVQLDETAKPDRTRQESGPRRRVPCRNAMGGRLKPFH